MISKICGMLGILAGSILIVFMLVMVALVITIGISLAGIDRTIASDCIAIVCVLTMQYHV